MTTAFWRPAEAIKQLGLSRSTFYGLVQQGRLPRPMKLGGRLSLWDAAALVQAYRNLLRQEEHHG